MVVTIKNVPWRFGHGLIRRCCNFVLSKFLSFEKMSRVEIEVVGIPNLMDKQGAIGFCSVSDEHFGSGKRSPEWFTIELDTSLTPIEFLCVLCHELVHVKQYCTKQLREKYYPKYSKMWKDKDITSLCYSKSPHELEAYRREQKLLSEFIIQYNLDVDYVDSVSGKL